MARGHGTALRPKSQDRIDGLAARPPEGTPPDTFADIHDIPGDPRQFSPAYSTGAPEAHEALLHDYGEQLDPELPPPGMDAIRPGTIIYAALKRLEAARGHDASLIPPVNVRAAQRRPDYTAPNGWKEAMQKEISRVIGFKAFKLVPMSEYHANAAKHPGKVSVGYIVAVLRCKQDPSGDARGGAVTNKFRVSVAEPDAPSTIQTYSSCADDISNRAITAIGPTLRAHQTSIDVGGAYYFGTPPTLEEGGRLLYAVIPPWLSEFGDFPTHDKQGRKNMLLIQGNMPGRADAGRIWQKRFDEFLIRYGLRQLLTDRRVWVMNSPRGILIIHDHVDDSRLTATTVEARTHFYQAWALEFNSPPESAELSEDFTGLRHHRTGPLTTEITCGGVIRSLVDHIALCSVGDKHVPPTTPMPADALRQLRDPPKTQAHLRADLVPLAQ